MPTKRKPKRAQLPVLVTDHHPDSCPACLATSLVASRIDDLEDILAVRFGHQLTEAEINGAILGTVLDWAVTFVGAGGAEEFDEPYRSLLRRFVAMRKEPAKEQLIVPNNSTTPS